MYFRSLFSRFWPSRVGTALFLTLGTSFCTLAADAPIQQAALTPPAASDPPREIDTNPTITDVPYGPCEKNKLDFWKALSGKPTPLIVEIHGGGFYEGDKSGFRHDRTNIARCLSLGVSLASINYRFIGEAPIQDILRDSARAIQFLRYNATDWNIDKTRIAAFGESAGAGTSLWLAFHDDLADPGNPDPVLRESTRLKAAGAESPQATYDFSRWPQVLDIPQYIWQCSNWFVSPSYYHMDGLHVFKPEGRKVRADLDMLAWIDPNDPPVYLWSKQVNTNMSYVNLCRFGYAWATQMLSEGKVTDPNKVIKETNINFDILHHPAHTQTLEKTCQRIGVPCTTVYRDTPEEQKITLFDFLLKQLLP